MKEKEQQTMGGEVVFGWFHRLFNKKAEPKKDPKTIDMVGLVLPPAEPMSFGDAVAVIMAPPKHRDNGNESPKKGDDNKPPVKKT